MVNSHLLKLLQERKASRAISTQKCDDEIIEKLMHAAQLSASCFNNQPWRFLFLTEELALEKAGQALSNGNSWAKKAPLMIVGFSKSDLDCQLKDGRDYFLFDLGMATQLILLQATELDLVARPMAGFSPEVIMREFDIPDEYMLFIMIAVGYEGNIEELDEMKQKVSTEPRKRNPLSMNFFKNKFVRI